MNRTGNAGACSANGNVALSHCVKHRAKTKSPVECLGFSIMFYGSPTWARTRDLRINSPALYRLSYRGTACNYSQLFEALNISLHRQAQRARGERVQVDMAELIGRFPPSALVEQVVDARA